MFTQSTPSSPSTSLFPSSSPFDSSPRLSAAVRSPSLLPTISHTRLRGNLESPARHLQILSSTSREHRATTPNASTVTVAAQIAPQVVNNSPPPVSPSATSYDSGSDVPFLSCLDRTSVDNTEPPSTDDSRHSVDNGINRQISSSLLQLFTRSGPAFGNSSIIIRPAPLSDSIDKSTDSSRPPPKPDHHHPPSTAAAPTASAPTAITTTVAVTASSSGVEEKTHTVPSSTSSAVYPETYFPPIPRHSIRNTLQKPSSTPSDSAVPAALARIKNRSLLCRLRHSQSQSSPSFVTATKIQPAVIIANNVGDTRPLPGNNISVSNSLSTTIAATALTLPLPFSDFPITPPPHNNSNATIPSSRFHTPNTEGLVIPLISRATNRPSYIPRTAVNDPNYERAGMTRTRSATSAEAEAASSDPPSAPSLPSIRFSTYLDPRSHRPSLTFTPISRTLPTGGEAIRVGRYSERDGHAPVPNGTPSAAPVGFKSKVVSRRHCEFWYENNRWYIKDVKSSSGTFLNHIRLSPPGTESKPFPVNDGDIVQLGIDFKGGEEMIFRCVKMRLELNRNWQTKLNAFNMSAHNKLKALAGLSGSSSSYTQDCSICLNSIAPCQSLFVAPCSHTWHYKCVRTLITSSQYPIFVCPNCRATTDLEMDPEEPDNSHLLEWQKFNGMGEANGDAQALLEGLPAPLLHIAGPAHPNSDQPQNERVAAQEDNTVLVGITGANEAETTVLAVEAVGTDPVISSPVPIPRTIPCASPDPARGHVRTQTPNGVPVVANGHEGPITPRNDAGPWVFDGSAGRPGAAAAPNGVVSLDSAMDVD